MPGCGLQTRPGAPARGRRTVFIRRGIRIPARSRSFYGIFPIFAHDYETLPSPLLSAVRPVPARHRPKPTASKTSPMSSAPTARVTSRTPTGSSRTRPWRISTRSCAALRERAVAQVAVVAVDDIAGGDRLRLRRRPLLRSGAWAGRKQQRAGHPVGQGPSRDPLRHGRRARGRAARRALQAHPAQIHASGLPPGRLQPRHGAGGRSRVGSCSKGANSIWAAPIRPATSCLPGRFS